MLHFFISLLFLFAAILLFTGYFIILYFLFLSVQRVRARFFCNNHSHQDYKYKIKSFKKKSIRTIAIIFLAITSYSVMLYTIERAKWTGSDNANLDAKEYFVVGQTLNVYKAILTAVFHPELPFIVPITQLQWLIYKKGVALLPENDGEAGVWQNMWFHHHFGKKDRQYFGVRHHKPSPKMIKILDQYWFSLESMATKPFADKEMKEKYMEGFAGLAFSYTLMDGFYSGEFLGSAQRMAKMPEMVQRAKNLVQWLNELFIKWNHSPEIMQTVQNNPKLLILYQLTILTNLYDIILGEIHSGKFHCKNNSIYKYVQMRKEFYSPENKVPAYTRIKDYKEREHIYHIAINSSIARDIKYIIEHYCGYEVAGKIRYAYRLASLKKITPEKQEEFECRSSLREEIQIIEGVYYGRK